MEIRINTYDDLLNFLDRKDITVEQALYVVSKSLKVWGANEDFKSTKDIKERLISFLENYGYQGQHQWPLFL